MFLRGKNLEYHKLNFVYSELYENFEEVKYLFKNTITNYKNYPVTDFIYNLDNFYITIKNYTGKRKTDKFKKLYKECCKFVTQNFYDIKNYLLILCAKDSLTEIGYNNLMKHLKKFNYI